MSTDPSERPEPGPLTSREVFDLLLREPAVRPYLYAALGALALVFLVLFDNGSDLGAVLVALLGAAALAFRWSAGPAVVLVLMVYFLLFPFGIPEVEFQDPFQVRDSHFRVADLVFVLAALVYVRSTYRVFGLVHVALPLEHALKRPGDVPPRRPPEHVAPTEAARMAGTAVVLVLLAQGVWWLVNAIDFRPADGFPFKWADTTEFGRYVRRGPRAPGEFDAGESRFFVMLFGLLFGYLLLRLVFGYWRLRAMSAAEGATVLADTSWAETHRERVRIEKKRVAARDAAVEAAKKAAEAERAARRKAAVQAREEERRRARAAARRGRPRADDDTDDRPRRPRR